MRYYVRENGDLVAYLGLWTKSAISRSVHVTRKERGYDELGVALPPAATTTTTTTRCDIS